MLADLVLVLIVLYSAGKSFLCEISEIRETQKEKKKKTPPQKKEKKKEEVTHLFFRHDYKCICIRLNNRKRKAVVASMCV